MVFGFGKKKAVVKGRVEIFEAASSSELVFANLARDDLEEKRVKAAALAAAPATGGWLAKEGRKHDNVIDRSVYGLVELFTAPGHFDSLVMLALGAFVVHMVLLAAWSLEVLSGPGNLDTLVEETMSAVTLTDTSTRLAVMYACGHLIVLGKVLHACVGTEVQKFTPFYFPLVLVCLVVGGPACALAVSCHCESMALKKEETINTKQNAYLNKEDLKEGRSGVADAMQWLWLLVLAATVAGSASAFSSSALAPEPADGSLDLRAILLYVFWPVDLLSAATRSWLTPASGALIADWVGVLLVGVLSAAADGDKGGGPEGLLGVGAEYDAPLRIGLVCLCAFPSPYVGLALYVLLDTRHRAENPLLPTCSGGLRGPQRPRAMTTWEARVQADQHGRNLI